jgi:hypothetical protein
MLTYNHLVLNATPPSILLTLLFDQIHHYFAKRRAVLQVLRLAELQFDDLLAELRLMPDAAAVRVTRNADKCTPLSLVAR